MVGTTYNIPYCTKDCTKDMVKFYKTALHHAKGVLVLDCMVPWVSVADSSVLDKASLVQNLLVGATGNEWSSSPSQPRCANALLECLCVCCTKIEMVRAKKKEKKTGKQGMRGRLPFNAANRAPRIG